MVSGLLEDAGVEIEQVNLLVVSQDVFLHELLELEAQVMDFLHRLQKYGFSLTELGHQCFNDLELVFACEPLVILVRVDVLKVEAHEFAVTDELTLVALIVPPCLLDSRRLFLSLPLLFLRFDQRLSCSPVSVDLRLEITICQFSVLI